MSLLDKLPFKIPAIDEKTRPYLIGGILFVILLTAYFIFMRPILRYFVIINPKISLSAKELKAAREDIANIERYRQQVTRLRERMKEVGYKILLKEEIPIILENISRIANELNIRIDQIMPLKESQEEVLKNDEGRYYSLPVLINARGSYHNIGRFFNRIEADKVFMTISDFDISSTSDNPVRHSIKLTIRTFVLDKSEAKDSQ